MGVIAPGGQNGGNIAPQGKQALGVVGLDRQRAPYGNGFEIFRAHDGAGAAPGGCAADIADDAGEAHSVFAGRTDGQETIIRTQFSGQDFNGFRRGLSPEVGGAAERNLFVVDNQHHRSVGAADGYQGVKARLLQRRAKMAAKRGIGDSRGVGQRRVFRRRVGGLGHDGYAGSAGKRQAGQRARPEHQGIGGGERVQAGRGNSVPETFDSHAAAAQKQFGCVHIGFRRSMSPGSKIDFQ